MFAKCVTRWRGQSRRAAPRTGVHVPRAASRLAAAKALGLSRVEALQLLNLRPTTLVELHLVIANCEARLAPERLDELLALVAQHLRS